MLATLTSFFRTQWQRLTLSKSSRRLSWFSLILVFVLDAYVLSLLFDGMGRIGQVIEAPYPAMSQRCVALSVSYLERQTDEGVADIEQFARDVHDNREGTINAFDYLTSGRHPVCDQIRDKLLAIVDEPELSKLLAARRQQLDKIERITDEVRRLKLTYSDALLEKMADLHRNESILPVEASKIKATVDAMNADLTDLKQKRDETWTAIKNVPAIANYSAFLNQHSVIAAYQRDREQHENALRWYPVKIIALQTAFLLPLLALTLFWNRRALDKQREASIMISSHLIVVGGIPIALRLLQFLREYLPMQLLDWLLHKLEQWHIGFLWYYGLIFASVASGLLLIFWAQRILFTPARQRKIRWRKVLCQNCGEKLSSIAQTCCEACGAEQVAACGHCGQMRRLLAFHCGHCGTAQPARE